MLPRSQEKRMKKSIKATLMALGAVAVLLLAGGFPPTGVPGVYHGGAMLLAGLAALVLCLWGAWRLAAGQRALLAVGLVCIFLALAGVCGFWSFGAEAYRMARVGGPMWFGAVGVGCMAAIGMLFAAIFGFLAWRVMSRKLWLAALHLCGALTLLGAWGDALYGQEQPLSLPIGSPGEPLPLSGGGTLLPFVTHFDITRYEGSESYTLLRHENGRWVPLGTPQRQGDAVVYGTESWPVEQLQRVARMPQPFLLIPGQPPRLLLQNEAPVKGYRADCRFTIRSGTEQPEEVRELTLRVNEPAAVAGWRFYLMSYRPLSGGGVRVELLARRAPGRWLTLLGLWGIILCTAGWCYHPGNTDKQAQA